LGTGRSGNFRYLNQGGAIQVVNPVWMRGEFEILGYWNRSGWGNCHPKVHTGEIWGRHLG